MTAENHADLARAVTHTRADLAGAVLLWSAIASEAHDQAVAARAELERDARADLEANGAAPTWRIAGMCTVPLATTTAQVVVDDPAAYTRWLEQRYPTKVETLTRPLDAFDVAFRRTLAAGGDPPCDPATGELVPGLRFVAGGEPRGVSVRPEPGVKARMAAQARTLLGLSSPDGGERS